MAGPPSHFGCALSRLGQSLARVKKLRAQHPLRAEVLCPEKSGLGWVNMHLYNFFVCGPKLTRFLLSNLGGVVVDQILFGFLMCPHAPEIFAIKVKVVRNRAEIWTFLGAPKFLGAGLPKVVRALSPLPRVTSSGKVHQFSFAQHGRGSG